MMGIFDSLGNQPGQQNQPRNQQNQQAQMQQAIQQIKQNPGAVLSQAGYNVPDNLLNDPAAIIRHLKQSGQIPAQQLQRFGPILQRMGL